MSVTDLVAGSVNWERFLFYRSLLPNPEFPDALQKRWKPEYDQLPWWRKLNCLLKELIYTEHEDVRVFAQGEAETSYYTRNAWTFKVFNLVNNTNTIQLSGISNPHKFVKMYLPEDNSEVSIVRFLEKEKKEAPLVDIDETAVSATLYAACRACAQILSTKKNGFPFLSSQTEASKEKILQYWTNTCYDYIHYILNHIECKQPQVKISPGMESWRTCWLMATQITKEIVRLIYGDLWLHHQPQIPGVVIIQEDTCFVDVSSICDQMENSLLQFRDLSRVISHYHRRHTPLGVGSSTLVKHIPWSSTETTFGWNRLLHLVRKWEQRKQVEDLLQVEQNIQSQQGPNAQPVVLRFSTNQGSSMSSLRLYTALQYYSIQYGIPQIGLFTVVMDQEEDFVYAVLSNIDLYHIQFGLTYYLCSDKTLIREKPVPIYPTLLESITLMEDEVITYFSIRALHQLLAGEKTSGKRSKHSVIPQPGSKPLQTLCKIIQFLPHHLFGSVQEIHEAFLLPLTDPSYYKTLEERQSTTRKKRKTQECFDDSYSSSKKTYSILSGTHSNFYRSFVGLLEFERRDRYIEEDGLLEAIEIFNQRQDMRLKYWRAALVLKLLVQKLFVENWKEERQEGGGDDGEGFTKFHRSRGRPKDYLSEYEVYGRKRRIRLPTPFTVCTGAVFRIVDDDIWFTDVLSESNPLQIATESLVSKETIQSMTNGSYGKEDVAYCALRLLNLSPEEESFAIQWDPILKQVSSTEEQSDWIEIQPSEVLYELCATTDFPVSASRALFLSLFVGSGDVTISRRPLGNKKALSHVTNCALERWFDFYFPPDTAEKLKTSFPCLPEYSLVKEPISPQVASDYYELDKATQKWSEKKYSKSLKEFELLSNRYKQIASYLPVSRDIEEVTFFKNYLNAKEQREYHLFLQQQQHQLDKVLIPPTKWIPDLSSTVIVDPYQSFLYKLSNEDNRERDTFFQQFSEKDDSFYQDFTIQLVRFSEFISQLERMAYYPMKKDFSEDSHFSSFSSPSFCYYSSSSSSCSSKESEYSFTSSSSSLSSASSSSSSSSQSRKRRRKKVVPLSKEPDRKEVSNPYGSDHWPSFDPEKIVRKKREYPLMIDASGNQAPLYPTDLFPMPVSAILETGSQKGTVETGDSTATFPMDKRPLEDAIPGLLDTVIMSPIPFRLFRKLSTLFPLEHQ